MNSFDKRPPFRLNMGCGAAPTDTWINFDNSLSVVIGRNPIVSALAQTFRIVAGENERMLLTARTANVRHANVVRRIPVAAQTVEVLYSSHMVEHLDRQEVKRFLGEAMRVLRKGGRLRIVVPDLRWMVERYTEDGDADAFIER